MGWIIIRGRRGRCGTPGRGRDPGRAPGMLKLQAVRAMFKLRIQRTYIYIPAGLFSLDTHLLELDIQRSDHGGFHTSSRSFKTRYCRLGMSPTGIPHATLVPNLTAFRSPSSRPCRS